MLENLYGKGRAGLTAIEIERVIVALDWYNQTYQEHPVRDRRSKIVDMATAFEVLFDLPQDSIKGAFRSCIQVLLGSSKELITWANVFYDVRSQVIHRGRTETLAYKHPEASVEHIDFLWSARRLFAWCIEVMLGGVRGLHAREIIEVLTPNEVHMTRIMKSYTVEKKLNTQILREVGKLRPVLHRIKREDVVKLGKILLNEYKDQYLDAENDTIETLNYIIST
ncbi:MAG: hypothetical protein ACYSR0_07560, partial [Planctomycetota bacterium]